MAMEQDQKRVKLPRTPKPPHLALFELFTNFVSIVISFLYLWYYEKFHRDYEYNENHDSNLQCPYMFPTWMYVAGIVGVSSFGVALVLSIIGLLTPYIYVIFGEESACTRCYTVWMALIVTLVVCAMIPFVFFSIGWGLYGLILLEKTDASCQRSMYYLALYSYIWWAVSFSCICCMNCCHLATDLGDEANRIDEADSAELAEPLLPTHSPPQSQQSTATTDHTAVPTTPATDHTVVPTTSVRSNAEATTPIDMGID